MLAGVVGDRDHTLVVEEIGGSPADELNVGAIVDACLTPPFLIDLRVVVVRDAGRLLTADVPRLVEVVQEPLPTTVLILVAGGGTIPAPLVKALGANGEIVDVSTSKAGDRKAWLHEHLREAPVQLDRGATDLLADHVGEDLGRVEGLLSALSAAYGEGASVSADDLEPYLGEAGNLPRYALTDAIDRGEARDGAARPPPPLRSRRIGTDADPRHAARALRQHAGARRRGRDRGNATPPPSSARRPSSRRRPSSSRAGWGARRSPPRSS